MLKICWFFSQICRWRWDLQIRRKTDDLTKHKKCFDYVRLDYDRTNSQKIVLALTSFHNIVDTSPNRLIPLAKFRFRQYLSIDIKFRFLAREYGAVIALLADFFFIILAPTNFLLLIFNYFTIFFNFIFIGNDKWI